MWTRPSSRSSTSPRAIRRTVVDDHDLLVEIDGGDASQKLVDGCPFVEDWNDDRQPHQPSLIEGTDRRSPRGRTEDHRLTVNGFQDPRDCVSRTTIDPERRERLVVRFTADQQALHESLAAQLPI